MIKTVLFWKAGGFAALPLNVISSQTMSTLDLSAPQTQESVCVLAALPRQRRRALRVWHHAGLK